MNKLFKSKNKRSAFSLIELSIVLLVVGIIIAGITQSSRLVNKMKLYMARSQTQSSPVHSIADLLFWFEATSEKSFANQGGYSEIEDGDTIKNWYDVSPLNSDRKSVSQDEQTYQPTYIENGINGLPSVRFDSTNDDMRLTGDLGSGIKSEMTIFLVTKPDGNYNATDDTSVIADFSDTSNNYSAIFQVVPFNGVPEITHLFLQDEEVVDRQDDVHSPVGQILITTLIYDPSKNYCMMYSTVSNDSIRRYSGGSASLDFAYSPLTLTIGNRTSEARTFGGNIGEIVIFGRRLKLEEVISVEEYLKKKWGVVLRPQV